MVLRRTRRADGVEVDVHCRATPSDDRLYERLFHETRVPDDVFIYVFSYWRTPRDA